MNRVPRTSVYILGGLLCAGLAPAANAQTLLSITYTDTVGPNPTDFNSKTYGPILLPYFNDTSGALKGATLEGVDLSFTSAMTTSGTLTNNGTGTETINDFTVDTLTNYSGKAGGATRKFDPDPFYDAGGFTLAPGASATFSGGATVKQDTGLLLHSLNNWVSTTDFDFNYKTVTTYTPLDTNIAVAESGTATLTGTVTYYYFGAPVPEVASSLGLGAMILGGGLLSLRRRRSKQA